MRTSRFQRGCPARLVPGVIVFVSGASALTYEIIWQREMLYVFGASAPATAATLTAVFLGIAFGSRLSSGMLRNVKRPILLLAALEGVIGLWGILVPFAMGISESSYVAAAHAFGEEAVSLSLARFAFSIIPLLPSTLCMGATIPVMVSAFGRGASSAVAWIYGLNILGAVAGALTTGLVWIRVLGLSESAWVAISMNGIAVLLLLLRARTAKTGQESSTSPSTTMEPSRDHPFLSSMYFAAGFVALGLEVVWLRYLGIVNTNSTVTFSLTLAFYLCGMGVGSLFCYPLLRRFLAPYSIFALANGGVAVTSLATFPVIFAAPSFNRSGIEIPAAAGTLTLGHLYQTEALMIFLLLFLPTLFMGMVYPAVCDSVPVEKRSRRNWIANAYFLGTLGCVAGTIAIPLFVIPSLGLHATFSGLVTTSAVLCTLAVIFGHRGYRRNVSVAAMGLTVLCAAFIPIDGRPVLRNTVARKVGEKWMEFRPVGDRTPSAEIVRFKAGASGTVIIKREAANTDLLVYVDDQLVASTNTGARVDALMLAHLPLLLHPDPRNELTVGFGSGGTSHAITTHGIPAFCVEIEAEVLRSAHLLTGQNYGVLESPLFNPIRNDARDHLKITQRQYDVIATDVTNLHYKQNGSLYTVEYYQLMKDRMRPGGVACAWIPMAAVAKDELQILMKTFQSVFPHATLWFMNHTHTNFGILIGTPQRLQIDYSRLEEGFNNPSVADSLKQIGLTVPMQLVHCLHLDEDGCREFCSDVPLHTDNHPILEFSTPLSFYKYYETFWENLSSELEYRPDRFHKYVINGPDDKSNLWEQHRIASLAGCRVILSMYQFQIARARGETVTAMQILKEAINTAQHGMNAWPEDKSRETFYSQFFDDADRWAMSKIR